MSISKFFKLFKFSTSANSLSKVDSRILNDMGIAAPYATLLSIRAPFEVGNDRI